MLEGPVIARQLLACCRMRERGGNGTFYFTGVQLKIKLKVPAICPRVEITITLQMILR